MYLWKPLLTSKTWTKSAGSAMARNLPSELKRSDLTAPIRPLSTARLLPGCLMSHIRVVVSCIHVLLSSALTDHVNAHKHRCLAGHLLRRLKTQAHAALSYVKHGIYLKAGLFLPAQPRYTTCHALGMIVSTSLSHASVGCSPKQPKI